MRISKQTRDTVLFVIGCSGMLAHGIVFPVAGYPFEWVYFAGFAAMAGAPVVWGRRENGSARG